PVDVLAEQADDPRPEASHLSPELLAAFQHLLPGKIGGARRHPADQVRDAEAVRGQEPVLFGPEAAIREASLVQERPEMVRGPGEVVAGRGRVPAGVIADEEHPSAIRDDVRQASRPALPTWQPRVPPSVKGSCFGLLRFGVRPAVRLTCPGSGRSGMIARHGAGAGRGGTPARTGTCRPTAPHGAWPARSRT